ncbi:MAG: ABC transporter [Elusimicrobia bacterium CG08_land_8_20_14_0_20_51_18]|nr:MAG: ABC transporter [Elusimicrobia bacterium CG08_land_8_20_14_0_20_51_18]
MSLIKAENISFGYNGLKVLKNLSFAAGKGEFISVIGHNGSGKSTLLKIISGLCGNYSGAVLVNDENIRERGPAELAKSIAFVPGEIYSPFEFPAEEIILMGRSPYKKWWESYGPEDLKAVNSIMREFGIEGLRGRSVNKISSGERQLVFLAQALAQGPEILLLDEPTSHLDLNFKVKIFELLLKIKAEKGISIICVSHDLKLVASYSDLALVLKAGERLFFGKAGEILGEEIISRAYNIHDKEAIKKII